MKKTLASEIVYNVSKDILDGKVKSGKQEDGSWVDPAYLCFSLPVEDICPQAENPNYMAGKAFAALQTSIWNNGMSFPVLVARNPLYDPSTEGMEKPLIFKGGQDVVDVRDPEVRKFFKYTIVDGTHRLMAVLYGSPLYKELNNKKSIEIYERCNGLIPCTILEDKTEHELMSAEILFNSARGEHSIDSMKDIVSDLSRSGLSDQWIAKNLFLEMEAITRFKQLSGMRAAFNNEEFKEDAWDPIKEQIHKKRANINLTNAAVRYVRTYKKLVGEDTVYDDPNTDIQAAAEALGWDKNRPNEIPKVLDENGKVFQTELFNSEE